MLPDESGRSWQQPNRLQGLVFDGAMFLANIFVIGSLISFPVEELGDQAIGMLLGLGVLAQFLGALLKKGPLQQRITMREGSQSKNRENFLGCLSFIHFIFFLLVTAMALALVGFVNLNESGGVHEFVWVLISASVAAITSGTVWLAIRYSTNESENDKSWPYQEVVANVLLWVSATILTRFFWNFLLIESEPPTYMGFSLRALVFLAAASALFVVFYVPARLLFLAEDYKYPTTWLRLWLVAMLPLMTTVFFGQK